MAFDHLPVGEDEPLIRDTPPEWLPLGMQVAEICNGWAGRGDLVAYVAGGDAGGRSAGACYLPQTAEIELNVEKAFSEGVMPFMIDDMTERATQFDNLKATGAIWHEAMHARFTRHDLESALEDMKPKEYDALMLLEESRIEAQGLRVHPQNRAFIRACALDMVLKDQDKYKASKLTPTRSAVRMLGLSRARVDAGVLKDADIKNIRKVLDTVLTDKQQAAFQKLWLDFQDVQNSNTYFGLSRLQKIAKEWVKLTEKFADENGDPTEKDIQKAVEEAMNRAEEERKKREENGEPEPEPGEGDADGEGEGIEVQFSEAAEEDAENTEIEAQTEGNDQKQKEREEAEAKDAEARYEETQRHKGAAGKVFNKGFGPGPHQTNSRLRSKREPTGAEWIAANTIADELDHARYRDRDREEVLSVEPPGRLRTRNLVQNAAIQERNLPGQVAAFRRTKYHQVEEPPLTLGVMTDISGSMGSAMEQMASAAWIFSQAAKQIDAEVAMVNFGNAVYPTLEPGMSLDHVYVYSADDNMERFDEAFQALDGTLNLINGVGARMLVVVSDGHYKGQERQHADTWLARCRAENIAVLWVGLTGSYGGDVASEYCRKNGATYYQTHGASVTEVAEKIGRAAADALADASASY